MCFMLLDFSFSERQYPYCAIFNIKLGMWAYSGVSWNDSTLKTDNLRRAGDAGNYGFREKCFC